MQQIWLAAPNRLNPMGLGVFLIFRQTEERIPTHLLFEKGCISQIAKKITFHGHSTQTYVEVFQTFITAKTAKMVTNPKRRNASEYSVLLR